jgi:GTPase SAR1 family protein
MKSKKIPDPKKILSILIFLKQLIEKIAPIVRKWWNGKKIAIIGPPAVGKNSFYRRLKGEALLKKYVQTTGTNKVKSFTFRQTLPNGKDFRMRCKRCINVGGENRERDRYWLNACKDADIIFYMIDLKDLKKREYREQSRIYSDLKWLATNFGEMKANTLVHFMINKIDVDLLDSAKYKEFIERIRPKQEELEKTAKNIFGAYEKRLTGITPISMKDKHIFKTALPMVLDAVYNSVHTHG